MPFQLKSDGARQFLLLAEKGLQIKRERKSAMASALCHSACSWAMSALLIPFSSRPIRFTSTLGEYFDLFQHIILFWKMGTTTGHRSQADNQFWGCYLSKLTDPQEYRFESAACKHCSWTSSSVLLIVFIPQKPLPKPPSYHLQVQHWFTLLCWICWKPRKMDPPSGALTQSLSEHRLKPGWLVLQSPKYNMSGKDQWESYTSNSHKSLILFLLESRGVLPVSRRRPSFLTIPPSALRTAQGTAVATGGLKNLLLG